MPFLSYSEHQTLLRQLLVAELERAFSSQCGKLVGNHADIFIQLGYGNSRYEFSGVNPPSQGEDTLTLAGKVTNFLVH